MQPRIWDGQISEPNKVMTLILFFCTDQVMEAIKASFDTPKDLQYFGHKYMMKRFSLTLSVKTVEQEDIVKLCYNTNFSHLKKRIRTV